MLSKISSSASLFDVFLGHDFDRVFGSKSYTGLLESKTDKGFSVSFDVPGYRAPAIEVTLDGRILSLRGNKDNRVFHVTYMIPQQHELVSDSVVVEDGVLTVELVRKNTSTKVKVLQK